MVTSDFESTVIGSFGQMNYVSQHMCEAFEYMGMHVECIAFNSSADIKNVMSALAQKPDLIYAGWRFYNFLIDADPYDAVNLFDLFDVPVIAMLGDHVYSHFMTKRLNALPENIFFISGYDSILAEIRRIKGIKDSQCQQVNFPIYTDPEVDTSLSAKRDIDLLVPMKIFRTDATIDLLKKQDFKNTPLFPPIIDELYAKCRHDVTINMFDLALQLISSRIKQPYDFDKMNPRQNALVLRAVDSVDMVIRSERRVSLLKQVLKNVDMRITVLCGDNFLELLGDIPPNEIKGELKTRTRVEAPELLKLYARSRYVLNCNPTYYSGIHERIRNSASSGCCVISDENSTLTDKFRHAESMYFSSRFTEQQYVELKAEEKRFEVARRGREIIQQHYNKQQFFDTMQSFVENQVLATG